MLSALRHILWPFSLLYGSITALRNKAYDSGFKSSTGFELPVICVGNLTVGGTGKTPFIEYLIELLAKNQKIGVVSRGYGRQSSGIINANEESSAAQIGDEPFQIWQKYKNKGIEITVGAERPLAVANLLQNKSETNLILLDDAFQHRPIKAGLNIMLTDHKRLFTSDFVMPVGRLREYRSGAKRADIIVVTKCPELSEIDRAQIEKRIHKYSSAKVFFTKLRYDDPKSILGTIQADIKEVILITGIAQPKHLKNHLQKSGYKILHHFDFPDHKDYSETDLLKVYDFCRKNDCHTIISTEKDAVKLINFKDHVLFKNGSLFVVPVNHHFLEGASKFEALIHKFLDHYS